MNIADVAPHLAGRTREAIEVAREGLEAEIDSPWRTVVWFRLGSRTALYYLGDWDEAEAAMPAPSRRHTGGTFCWQLNARRSRWVVATSRLPMRRSGRSTAHWPA